MKHLVATTKTQGKRNSDFSWTNEGEIVNWGFECTHEEIDGYCGCKRSLCGIDSHKATTTVEVVCDPDMTIDKLAKLIADSLVKGGWFKSQKAALWLAHENAIDLVRIANRYPAGAVLERRGNEFIRRWDGKQSKPGINFGVELRG